VLIKKFYSSSSQLFLVLYEIFVHLLGLGISEEDVQTFSGFKLKCMHFSVRDNSIQIEFYSANILRLIFMWVLSDFKTPINGLDSLITDRIGVGIDYSLTSRIEALEIIKKEDQRSYVFTQPAIKLKNIRYSIMSNLRQYLLGICRVFIIDLIEFNLLDFRPEFINFIRSYFSSLALQARIEDIRMIEVDLIIKYRHIL